MDIEDRLAKAINEAQQFVDENGRVPLAVLSEVIVRMPESLKAAFATALGLIGSLAAVTEEGMFAVYNAGVQQYLTVRVTDNPPDELRNALLGSFDGTIDAAIVDGVFINQDGVTVPTGNGCPYCGQDTCDDPADCREKSKLLNSVRSFNKERGDDD